jgi:hypothetical protein
VGVILITLGAIFFADRLGWEFAWGWHPSIARLWPVILIAIGLSRMVSTEAQCTRRGRSRPFGGGGWILVMGILFLLDQNRWLSFSKSWPLMIVAGGLSMIFERRGGGK